MTRNASTDPKRHPIRVTIGEREIHSIALANSESQAIERFANRGGMEQQRIQSPFSVRLLRSCDEISDPSQPDEELLLQLLPASYGTDNDDLVAPGLDDSTWIKKELDIRRLNKVITWLWVAGRPMPPRPLHYQILVNREIFLTEKMDMHLVWTTGRISLKPLPRFLLEPHFWSHFLHCRPNCSCSKAVEVDMLGDTVECAEKRLWKCAMGFLFSYAALIRHESDFAIAQEKHLLPAEVKWAAWRTFVKELDTEHIYPEIDTRFIYGELRLSRLNKIYRLSQHQFLRGYVSGWDRYGFFFQDNFTWLASATVHIAIALTAMQVGLATNTLASNEAFQSASYGFTMFSILGPLVAIGLIVVAFFCIFVNNGIVTVAYRKRRFHRVQPRVGK
ncbi:hypothetical protein EDB80DRAFT_717233 [Ilyonectria destructans]|nr:hypothetical protein EDB80DRAFT_717233 [Ilyonectria destructans]